jgi:hypothetical protein
VVQRLDGGRCAYCRTAETISGSRLTIDHIRPRSQGGTDEVENLCQCCRACNEFKASTTRGADPLTGEPVALFHPRREVWEDHFRWSQDGANVIGLTPLGRATVITLRMNHATVVAARRRWVTAGWHPPAADLAKR